MRKLWMVEEIHAMYLHTFSYKFQDVILVFCSVVFHWVNVPHFHYLFFNCRAFTLCPGSGYDKTAAINIVEHMPLWHDWASSSFEYILKSSVTGFWGRLLHNFLNNHQINIHKGCTTSSMYFLWDLSIYCQKMVKVGLQALRIPKRIVSISISSLR